jgi:hypothetical protein
MVQRQAGDWDVGRASADGEMRTRVVRVGGKGVVVTAKIQRWDPEGKASTTTHPREGRSRARFRDDAQIELHRYSHEGLNRASRSVQRGGQRRGAVSSAFVCREWRSGGCAAGDEGRC